VDASRLPRAWLSELAAKTVEDSKSGSFVARQSWRTNIVNDIERASLGIAFEFNARPSSRGQEGGRESGVEDDYLTIIRKYAVAMPSSEDSLQRKPANQTKRYGADQVLAPTRICGRRC
jgi:hypothetical protein